MTNKLLAGLVTLFVLVVLSLFIAQVGGVFRPSPEPLPPHDPVMELLNATTPLSMVQADEASTVVISGAELGHPWCYWRGSVSLKNSIDLPPDDTLAKLAESGQLGKVTEETYRNFSLDEFLLFDLLVEEKTVFGENKEVLNSVPIEASVVMGRGAIKTSINANGEFPAATGRSPVDGIMQEWTFGHKKPEEYKSPIPQGTNNLILDYHGLSCALASCSFSFVGVPRWEDFDNTDFQFPEEEYPSVDKADTWREIIDLGVRVPEEEAAARGNGPETLVYRRQRGERFFETIHLRAKGHGGKIIPLVVFWKTDRPADDPDLPDQSVRSRWFRNIHVVTELPPGFTWKIDGLVAEAERKFREKKEKEKIGG